VGELPVLVGDDCDDTGRTACCVRIRLVAGFSLNDRCFLLIDFPARYVKLSLCDLFGYREDKNMVSLRALP
jgi:hypothetical protein